MARKIEVQIVGDSKSLERAFKRSGSAGQTFEKRVLGMSKKAAFALGGLGLGAGALGVKFTKMAGDAEEVRSKFQVVFGAQMPKMVKQLDAFSEATGASRYQLRQQTADLGALLVPLVGTQREAAKLSVGFTKLATDLSSFNNVPVEEALLAIRSGLVGEAEPLRKFGVLLNEAAVKAEAYRSGIAKAGAELTEQQKVQARANLIMQQTKMAQDDATRTADSFTNQLRKLKNQASDTATDLGMKLLPVATAVLDALNEWGPVIADKLRPQLDRLSDWADTHREDFKQLFDDGREAAGKFAGALGKVGTNVDDVATKMGGWDDAFRLILGGVLANKLLGVSKQLGGIAGILSKIKGFGPVLAITIGVDLLMSDKLDRFTKWLDEKTGTGIFSFSGVDLFNAVAGGGNKASDYVWNGYAWVPKVGTKNRPAGIGDRAVDKSAAGATARGGIQLTTKQETSHETMGLAGYPAKDWFAVPGTAVRAPENGRVVRHSGKGGTSGQTYGWSLYYVGEETGNTYYIQHLSANRAPLGRYRKGDVLGFVSAWDGGAPHAHVGIKPGSVSKPTGAGGAAGGSGGTGGSGGGGGGGSSATPPLIPAKMRLALTRAEGTKNIGDDLTALRAMVAYLQKLLPKTKDVEKRIEITQTLNDLRSRIGELTAKPVPKKVDISEAIDFELMKQKLRDQFREGLERARKTVGDARSGFRAAFEGLGDTMLRVFDAKTEQLLANARAAVTEFGFTIGAGEETPAERELRQRREARIDADLQAALTKAKTAEEVADAISAIEDRRLEKQASAERAAADEALARERKRIEDERALTRDAFGKALTDLQAQWTRTNATTEQRTFELQQLMASFEIPFADVGTLLGQSFANGFLDELQVVFDRLNELAQALNRVTPAQAAEAVILAGGSGLAARSAALNAKYGLGLPSFQTGGVVPGIGPQLAIVHGGERVLPRHQANGGGDIVIQVDGETLARVNRRYAEKHARRNAGA